MRTAIIVLGVLIGTLSITMLIGYFFIVPMITAWFEPEPDSNAALIKRLREVDAD